MSSTKEVRNRIKAIKNIAKITKAMQMVAASKMKRAQDSTLKNRPYSDEAYKVYLSLVRDQEIHHPLMAGEKKATGEKKLLVVITSDKGLCGSFNTAVVRKALEYTKTGEADLITVGKKGQAFFKRINKNIIATYTDFPINPRAGDVRPLIHSITEAYQSNQYSEVAICFTVFESTLKQTPTIKTVLPFGADPLIDEPDAFKANRAGEPHGQGRAAATALHGGLDPKSSPGILRSVSLNGVGESSATVIKYEPSPKEVVSYLIPRILETWIYQMFLESIASEQSARMVAMKNATDAAGDLIDDLNLTYNSIRQASITQELAEISAATNAFERNE